MSIRDLRCNLERQCIEKVKETAAEISHVPDAAIIHHHNSKPINNAPTMSWNELQDAKISLPVPLEFFLLDRIY